MAPRNPAAALEALTHPATTKVGRFEVRELFFGTMAVLERIDSPLSRRDRNPSVALADWVETLYAMTHPGRACAALLDAGREAFRDAALEWADTVSNAEATALMNAVLEALRRLNQANPATDEPEEEEGGRADPDPTAAGPTAGSPGA